jgi:hypothetical protein
MQKWEHAASSLACSRFPAGFRGKAGSPDTMTDLTPRVRALVARLLAPRTHPVPPSKGVIPDGHDIPSDETRLLGLPLDVFAAAGEMIEVRVPWWSEPLWFVPGETAVEALVREGISRGRIWTAGELADLLSVPNVTKATARTVAAAKLAVDGDVTGVRRTA